LREYCPRAFGTWAIFPQLRQISITIDLDASHYLHNIYNQQQFNNEQLYATERVTWRDTFPFFTRRNDQVTLRRAFCVNVNGRYVNVGELVEQIG